MYMFVTAIFDGKSENFQPTQRQKQDIYDRWYLLDYLDKYTEVLRKEWERLGIKEPFPDRERDDREERYDYAREYLNRRMSECGIDSVHYKTSLLLPDLEEEEMEMEVEEQGEEEQDMEIEETTNFGARKSRHSFDLGQRTTRVRDPLDWTMGLDLEGLGLGQTEPSESRNLRNARSTVYKDYDVFTNPVPSTSAAVNLAQAQAVKNKTPAKRHTYTALPMQAGMSGNLGGNVTGNSNDGGGRNHGNYGRGNGGNNGSNGGSSPSSSGNGGGGGFGGRGGSNRGGGNFQGGSNLRQGIYSDEDFQALRRQPLRAFDRHAWKDIRPFSGQYLDFTRFIDLFIRLVDVTELDPAIKLDLLMTKLDPASVALIENYHYSDYDEALEVLFKEYTNETHVISHIFQKANTAPLVYYHTDLKGLRLVTERIRSVVKLLSHYELDRGYENELFKIFVGKIPRAVSSRYIHLIRNEPPSLRAFLRFLDDEVTDCRNQVMFKPGWEVERGNYRRPLQSNRGGKGIVRPRSRYPSGWGGYANHVAEEEEEEVDEEEMEYEEEEIVNLVRTGAGKGVQNRPSDRPLMKTEGSDEGSNGGGKGADRRELAKPCIKCSHPAHSALYCTTVTPEEKRGIVIRHRLCFRCLKSGHPARRCEVKDTCKCGRYHHHLLCLKQGAGKGFKKARPEKKGQANLVVEENEDEQFNRELLTMYENGQDYINTLRVPEEEECCIPLAFKVNGYSLTGVLDTGATVNMVPRKLVEKLGIKPYKVTRLLKTANGLLHVEEAVTVKVKVGNIEKDIEFLVYDAQPIILMSLKVLKFFKLILDYYMRVFQHDPVAKRVEQLCGPRIDMAMLVESETNQMKVLVQLIKANDMVFMKAGGQIGKIESEQCHIHLTSEIPVTLRPYPCSKEDRENINKQTAELTVSGMIRKSTSPYSFPVVLVDKKDEGKKTRMCINYIKLNDITESEHYPMPKIDEMKDLFLGAEYFTTVDIASGFHHIEVAPEDKKKTAFSTMDGHFEWNRMPFGLKNAPIIFQRVIANLLQKHELNNFALNYIDDIIIFSKTFEEHLTHLQRLFDMLRHENIKLKLSKCQFAKKSVVYLGFQIEKNTVSPLNSNTVAIEKAAAPTNVKDLRGFLGKINYYHKFIPNRAVLLYPLYQLLKKNTTWKWDEECQQAFEKVKSLLTSSPVLKLFDPKNKTILYTDASRKGLGAILKQEDSEDPERTQYVVGYFSKSLVGYQQNYSVTELELLAIISAIEYWHYYLVGQEFTVITDHLPLKSVGKNGKPNTRLFNWALRLRQYTFKVEYRPGNKNQEADYLSRNPVELLEDCVSGHLNWVAEDRIIRAQSKCQKGNLPKKVIEQTKQGNRRLIYRKGDIEKDYLPEELAKEVLQELHLEKGHLGIKKMEVHFTRKYYHPKLAPLLKEIVKECEICQRVDTQRPAYGKLGVIGPAQEPYEIIHIDTKSGFKGLGSTKDNLHLAIDSFSRFIWGVSSKTKTYIDFINLVNKIMTIQKPKLIVADNYPAIRCKNFQGYLTKNQIEMLFVAANHPETNGIVERANQTMTNRLRYKRLENPKAVWTTQVKECIDEYNNTIHSSTGYTPLYLMTGADPDGLFTDEPLQEARLKAVENSNNAHRRNAERLDRNRIVPNIEEGEKVFVQARHQLNRGMIEPKYEGPYEVVQKIGKSTVEVLKGGKPARYHLSQLKLSGTAAFARKAVVNSITVLAFLMLCLPIGLANVTIASPLLWQKTNHLAVVGYNFTTHVAMLMDPCSPLRVMERNNETSTTIDVEVLQCEQVYKEKIISLLERECEVGREIYPLGIHDQHLKRRHKRFIIPLLYSAMGAVVSYGIMAVEHHFAGMVLHENLKELDNKIASEINRIHKVHMDQEKIHKDILKKIQEQWITSNKVAADFKLEVHAEQVLTMILNTIDIMEIHLTYLLDGINQGKVTPDYRMLFRDSPILNSKTPTNRWTAHQCQFVKGKFFIMKFEIPVIEEEIKVLEAVSFYVVTSNEKGEQCLSTFKGNKYVLWDEKHDCTRDLLWEPIRENDLVLVNKEHNMCVDHENRTTQWKEVKCNKKLFRKAYVQIKQDENSYYVYCYLHELKVSGMDEIECKNVIYQFSRTKAFAIDGEVWDVKMGERKTKIGVNSLVNQIINQRTFHPDLGSKNFTEDLAELIHQEEEDTTLIFWKKTIKDPFVYGPVGGVGAIIILLALICSIYYCYHRFSVAGQFARRTDEMIAMRRMMRTER